jgi:Predicted metalloendopeptidase
MPYTSFMDEEAVEARGHQPIHERLQTIDRARGDKEELIRVMAQHERRGVGGLWQMFIDNDPGNPERYIAFVEQGGITLPDESYYREEQFGPLRAAFVSHIESVAGILGLAEPTRFAGRVMDVETRIASTHWDQVRCRDAVATYNLTSLDSWRSMTAGFDLDSWLRTLGVEASVVDEVVLRQPSVVQAWPQLWQDLDADALADWMSWQVIRSLSGYLSADLVDAHFAFFGRTLSGTPELRARWKRGVGFVESVLGEAVGKLYVENISHPRPKPKWMSSWVT